MKVISSFIFLMVALYSHGQYSYEDYLDEPGDEIEHGEAHENYLNDTIEIAEFDRELYSKLTKLMILKSRGQVTIDMDNIDPNFDPDQYFEERRYVDNQNDTLNMNVWNEDYSSDQGEYVEDWYEYEDQHDRYTQYQKEDVKEYKRLSEQKRADSQQQSQRNEQQAPASGGLSIILIILLILGIVVVVFLLISKSDKDKVIPKQSIDDLPPTEIPKSELELALEKALAEEDYRRAIRIYFIFIMKDLSGKGWIKWEKKKTNLLYLREMKGRPHYDSFKKVISIYEVVWYGKREINKSDYLAVEPFLKQTLIDFESHK